MSPEPTIRRTLEPGDVGTLIALHGTIYADEHDNDATFEGFVAASFARAVANGWPAEPGAVWIVEHDGTVGGSIALTDEGDDTATLRWVLLRPELRGRGLGRRLVGEAIETAHATGYRRLVLETFSDLRTAAHLYRSHGFELASAERGPRWGRPDVVFQHYELDLAAQRREPDARPRRAPGRTTLAA